MPSPISKNYLQYAHAFICKGETSDSNITFSPSSSENSFKMQRGKSDR